MRLLGLHGHGTSASIFRSQTSAFRSKLDPSTTFDFVDAPFEVAPSQGIDVFFDGPYFSHWKKPELDHMRASHIWLLNLIEEQGPYDGVICFSQGCSLISSFLLWHAAETPNAPLPFKIAIFICGGIPLSVVADIGIYVSPEAHEFINQTALDLFAKTDAIAKKADLGAIQRGVGIWDDVENLLHDPSAEIDKSDVFGLDFTNIPKDLRIRIPTVHIYGAKDPRWPSALQLVNFCDERFRRTYDHGGGHAIPRTTIVSNNIARLVEWATDVKDCEA